MRRSLVCAAAVASLTLAGCGGGDDDGSAATDPPAASVVDGATDTTALTADTVVESTAPATDAPAATDAPVAGDADCLQGTWRADATELQRRIDTIGAAIDIQVGPDSANDVVFDGSSFRSSTDISISATVPGGITLTAAGTNLTEGTFAVDGNVITGDVTNETSTFGDWEATLNGTPLPLPPDGFGPPPDVAPGFVGSTFTCDDNTLSFTVPGAPFGSITLDRVG